MQFLSDLYVTCPDCEGKRYKASTLEFQYRGKSIHDILTLTDKGLHCYSLGRQRNRDALEMMRIARGVDMATLDREPSVITVVNTNSPLRLDIPMAQGMMEFAAHNQPIVVTPFTLAGAMAPQGP